MNQITSSDSFTITSRPNINYQLAGYGMQLRYLMDALICSFMDIPVAQFVLLEGNYPASEKERMSFLDGMVSRIDMDFLKEAKSYIFNAKDSELAKKFCEYDLVYGSWSCSLLTMMRGMIPSSMLQSWLVNYCSWCIS